MNLNHLEYFLVLARTQHYTKAAELLHITQPTLSHAISNLESELNVMLFQKKGRNIILTEYGIELVAYVERSLSLINEGVTRIESLKNKKSKVIHLGFLYTLTSDYIPLLIQAFRKKYPEMEVEFSFFESDTKAGESTQELINGLKSGRFDVIFINRVDTFNKDLEFVELFNQDYCVISATDSEIAKFETIDLKEIEDYPSIRYANRYGTRNEIRELYSSVDASENVVAEIDDELSIASMVMHHVGYSVTPIKKMYEDYNLAVIPISNPVHSRVIFLGCKKNVEQVDSVSKFIEFAQKEFEFKYR